MRVTNCRSEKPITNSFFEKCLQSRQYMGKKHYIISLGKSESCTRHSFSLAFSFLAVGIPSLRSPSRVANNPMRIQRPMDAKNPHTHSLPGGSKHHWPSFIQQVRWLFVCLKEKKLGKKKGPVDTREFCQNALMLA